MRLIHYKGAAGGVRQRSILDKKGFMAVFDPWECEAARMCLAVGNPQAAARMLLNLPQRDQRAVQRLLLECGAALAVQAREAYRQGELTAAEDVLTLARQCAELTGDAILLHNQIVRARKETTVLPPPLALLRERGVSFGLRGRGLVVSSPVAVLGSVRNPDAHVPLLGRLHREHALISRHERRYWLARPPHHDEVVAINGAEVTSSQTLEHGDRIGLGGRDARGQRELTFLLPDRDSTTAVLKQEQRGVVTPSGDTFDRVVLLDDYLTIGPGPSAHLPAPCLACSEVRLTWSVEGLTASAAGGVVYHETPDGEWNDPPTPLPVPCRLVAVGDEGLADQVLQDYQCGATLDERIDLFDPRRRAP